MRQKPVQNASLIYKQDGITKHVILLPGNEVSFGRDKRNDVKLALFPLEELAFQWATADISRKHFVIRRNTTRYTIQDHGSTNGTSLDCIALLSKEVLLKNDCTLDVGGVLDLRIQVLGDVLRLDRITNTPDETYLLFPKVITIGNSCDSVISLKDNQVLSSSAHISYKDGSYLITNLSKSSKVILNTTSIPVQTTMPLENEAELTIGDVDIKFKVLDSND